ncbi:MAG: DUF7712 family protein [Dehalococcoidia bacterium]
MAQQEIWDLWFPNAAAQGLSFARGRLDSTVVLWVHAAPATLRVEVRADGGEVLAAGDRLARTADRPMTRLCRDGECITREDRWPEAQDLGLPVILPGGEVGILTSWWHAVDEQEWRWQVEFYNHR